MNRQNRLRLIRLRLGGVLLGLAVMGGVVAAEVPAQLAWVARVALAPLVTGVVTAVKVMPGERVRKGQVLLQLDPRPFAARVSAAEAELTRAQEAEAESKREQTRAQQMYSKMLSADHELQLANLAATQATAATQIARARLIQAQLDQEYSVIKAPFAGIVVAVLASEGQTVISQLQATPLLVLARADALLAQAQVSAAQLDSLKLGQEIPLRWGAQRVLAKIHALGLEPLVASGDEYRLEVLAPVPEGVTPRVGINVILELP